MRTIVEEALEAEVSDALGRGYYENGAEPGRGCRNGYRRGRLRTAEGSIEYGVPQVTDRAEPFASRLRPGLAGRTAELEDLAVEMYARGLIRAVETCFPRALRQRCLVHRQRNLRSKAPETAWPEIAARARGLLPGRLAGARGGVARRLHCGLRARGPRGGAVLPGRL